jgi:penicillin-binding protein 1A
LERAYTKDAILEYYLNEIWMGRGYGFQNASRNYLGKNLSDVNVAEAALLAAILNRPGTYDPFRYPERAKDRRDRVLRAMAAQGYLSDEEAERWQHFPLPEGEPTGVTEVAPYFSEWVRQILDDRYGTEVYSAGFRVYTTLDMDMQRAARAAMEAGWAAAEADSLHFLHPHYAEFDTVTSFPRETPYLQGAFVALDPGTGQVRAMIGGRDFDQSKFDRARQAQRQAGSGFKPFVYTAAIASGIPASHVVVDGPFVTPQLTGPDWRPENFTQDFVGPLTIREGMFTSRNLIAIHLGWEEVGIETVAQTARRMGIQTEIQRVPSTLIGAAAVRPLEMAEAYSTFPTLGTKVRPMPILRVEDSNGNVIWEPQPERTVVVDSLVARIMVSMLEDVVNTPGGTALNAVRNVAGLPWEVPAAGKTGTTNDGVDIWFNGFTPNLLALAWFGLDTPAPIFELGSGRQATGATIPAPVVGTAPRAQRRARGSPDRKPGITVVPRGGSVHRVLHPGDRAHRAVRPLEPPLPAAALPLAVPPPLNEPVHPSRGRITLPTDRRLQTMRQHMTHDRERELEEEAQKISDRYGAPVVIVMGDNDEGNVERVMTAFAGQDELTLREVLGLLETAIQYESIRHFVL